MRMKSFYARDVRTALERAREELGPDAMLVDSRKAPPEVRHLGACEVVVATDIDDAPPEPAIAAAARAALIAPGTAPAETQPVPPAFYAGLAAEVAELRRRMERMTASVTRSTLAASTTTLANPELMSAFGALIESGLNAELAHALLDRVRAEGAPSDRSRLRLALAAELAGRFTTEPGLGKPSAGQRIVALVGPCGAGKTTSLVKLAARFGLTFRRPTHIISADSYRVAACEQLRAYAAILGIGFHVAESARALAQAIEELRHKDLILIDTPGHSSKDLDASSDLAETIASHPDIDTHLVLSASMRSADLSRVADRFEVFRPAKLLFTKLDETQSYGPVINEAVRLAKPVSFLSFGQRVPEDLEPATKDRVIDLVLSRT